MYYRYNDKSVIVEKSETELNGANICTSGVDFNITAYEYVVGNINDAGEVIYYTRCQKPVNELAQYILELDNKLTTMNAELEVDTDFRLSLLELGLV